MRKTVHFCGAVIKLGETVKKFIPIAICFTYGFMNFIGFYVPCISLLITNVIIKFKLINSFKTNNELKMMRIIKVITMVQKNLVGEWMDRWMGGWLVGRLMCLKPF